jgi:Inner membrane component of T3SS, cytoplasmic domain
VVQLQILNGSHAAQHWAVRRFPFRIGRSPQADLTLEDAGIWDVHLQIDLDPAQGVLLASGPESFTVVNGHPAGQAPMVLRNGDLIEAGSVKIRFGLSPTRQYSLRFREIATWTALGALCLGQVWLIYWLLG